MKILLEKPYSEDWDQGYLHTNNDGRKAVRLILYKNNEIKRKTTSYARYILSVQLGRYLKEHEHVDHIDEDKTNDDPDNLQILTHGENNKKHVVATGKSAKIVLLTCQWCNEDFAMDLRIYNYKQSIGQRSFCCSRSCSRKIKSEFKHLYNLGGDNKISDQKISFIKELSQKNASSREIARKVNVSKTTVNKYR